MHNQGDVSGPGIVTGCKAYNWFGCSIHVVAAHIFVVVHCLGSVFEVYLTFHVALLMCYVHSVVAVELCNVGVVPVICVEGDKAGLVIPVAESTYLLEGFQLRRMVFRSIFAWKSLSRFRLWKTWSTKGR